MNDDDTKKKPEDALGSPEELFGELEQWDKMFDSLHVGDATDLMAESPLDVLEREAEPVLEPDPEPEPERQPAATIAEALAAVGDQTIADRPPSEQPVDWDLDDDGDVETTLPLDQSPEQIAVRRALADEVRRAAVADESAEDDDSPTQLRAVAAAPPADWSLAEPAAAEATEDELYLEFSAHEPTPQPGGPIDSLFNEEDVDLDGVPQALGTLLGDSTAVPARPPADEVYTSAVRPAGKPHKRAARRGPAIVRRADITKPAPIADSAREAFDEFGEGQKTSQIADELITQMAESAEQFFAEQPPEVTLEVDDDFYDGIEIADAPEGRRASTPSPVSTPPVSRPGAPRRTTQHLVRREKITGAPPVAGRPASHAENDAAEFEPHSTDDLAIADLGDAPPAPRGALDEMFDDLRAELEGKPARTARPSFADEDDPGTFIGVAPAPSQAPPAVPLARARSSEPPPRRARSETPSFIVRTPRVATEPEVDLALDSMTALDEGSLDPVDVAPSLPPPRLEEVEPAIDLSSVQIMATVEPTVDDPSEAWAKDLLWYEKELELATDPGILVQLRAEAGRLAERLGDLERARTHYDAALAADPTRVSALRTLRRVERTLGNWSEVVKLVDTELPLASTRERRPMAAFRAELLMAVGELDLARVSVGELVDAAPRDVRALLSYLELAYIDGRTDEFSDALERLAGVLTDTSVTTSLQLLRARLIEKAGGDPRPAYQAAIDTGEQSRAALGGLAGHLLRDGDRDGAASVLATLAGAPFAGAEPGYRAAVEWRRLRLLEQGSDAREVTESIASVAGKDPFFLELCAEASEERGDHARAADAWLELGERAPSDSARRQALRRAASLYAGPLRAPEEAVPPLRRLLELDFTDELARIELGRALEALRDRDGLDTLDAAAIGRDSDHDRESAIYHRVRIARRRLAAGDRDAAIGELSAAGPAGCHPVVDDLLVESLRAPERRADLAVVLERIAAADPSHADPVSAHRRQARVATAIARAAGEPEPRERAQREAVAAWRKVVQIDAESEAALSALLQLAESLGDRDLALEIGSLAQSAMPAVRAVSLALRRSQLLEAATPSADDEHGDLDRAVDQTAAEEVLREALAVAPGDPRVVWALVARLGAAKRWAEAAQVLAERSREVDDSDEANHLRYRAAAILVDRADDPAGAAELLAPLVAAHPGFSAGAELLASIRRRIGSESVLSPASRAAAAELSRQAPGDAFARLVREAEAIEESDPRRASDLYQQALELRRHSPLAREGLARAATAAGEPSPLAELALEDLRVAERAGDAEAKAAAYEELARIDLDLRGDPASALLGWQQAVDCEPTRMSALRALEKSYDSTLRHKDLHALYQRLITTVDDSSDAVPLALERARLADKLNLPSEEVLLDYRRALARDPRCRMALFRLESHERTKGFSPTLAELEQAVAEYFEADKRASAAFTTRSGETLAALGDMDAAITRFRAAADVVEGYAPALAGWRDVAVSGGRWRELADAASRAAGFAHTDDERARLLHLAGVALMDKALDGDAAVDLLRKVLTVDPRHDDAFARLRVLYDEQGRHEDLAQLITQRLAVDNRPLVKIKLHHELAALHRNFLDDRETARLHLRKVLELDPKNLPAVAELSDIAWELGAWADAAETLIARARLETNPRLLKGIFFRLGTIYADHLPDPTWAMKSFQKVLSYDPQDETALERIADLAMQTGEWKLALGACEQLIKLEPPIEAKVGHLHRVARIYQEGYDDPKRAERALRIALDLDPTNANALNTLIMFYRDAGDARSARVHLDRVAASMRGRLDTDPTDARAYEMIARTMHARSQLAVPGSAAIAQCAAEAAQLLGGTDQALAKLAIDAGRARPPLTKLVDPEIDDLLFPRSVPEALRALFRHLGDRLAKHVGVDIRRWGVGRGDKARRGADPAVAILFETAEAIGQQVDVYVSSRDPGVLAVEATAPLSIIIGTELLSADRPAELRFIAARAVKLATSSLSVPARLSADEFGVLLAGVLRQFKPEFEPEGLDPEQVAAEQQRLRRLIPSGMMQDLAPLSIGLVGPEFSHRQIWNGIMAGGNRAGLLAAGSAAAGVAVLARTGGYRDIQQAVTDPDVAGLLRFAVSEDHAQLVAFLES